jgi:hypothetical protein
MAPPRSTPNAQPASLAPAAFKAISDTVKSISAVEIREFLEKEAPDRRHAWENTNLTALRKECVRVMVERATRNKKAKQKAKTQPAKTTSASKAAASKAAARVAKEKCAALAGCIIPCLGGKSHAGDCKLPDAAAQQTRRTRNSPTKEAQVTDAVAKSALTVPTGKNAPDTNTEEAADFMTATVERWLEGDADLPITKWPHHDRPAGTEYEFRAVDGWSGDAEVTSSVVSALNTSEVTLSPTSTYGEDWQEDLSCMHLACGLLLHLAERPNADWMKMELEQLCKTNNRKWIYDMNKWMQSDASAKVLDKHPRPLKQQLYSVKKMVPTWLAATYLKEQIKARRDIQVAPLYSLVNVGEMPAVIRGMNAAGEGRHLIILNTSRESPGQHAFLGCLVLRKAASASAINPKVNHPNHSPNQTESNQTIESATSRCP